MPDQDRIRSAMAVETKAVKLRLDTDLEIGALAAMAMDTGVESGAVRIIMMAGETVHGGMLAVIEVQG